MAQADPESIRSTLIAAERGNSEARAQVEKWSKSWSIETIEGISTLADQVRRAMIAKAIAPESGASRCLMRREAELVGQMLVAPNASPMEKLLAEQVGINWLTVRIAELFLAEAYGPESARWQHRVDSAHRRLVSSIKTLAQVQRLQIPTLVQVNIQEQNVNVN